MSRYRQHAKRADPIRVQARRRLPVKEALIRSLSVVKAGLTAKLVFVDKAIRIACGTTVWSGSEFDKQAVKPIVIPGVEPSKKALKP